MLTELLALFGLLAVLLRAAILCFQTVAVGGIAFLLVVARVPQIGDQLWLHSAERLIRWSALALALVQTVFVISNTLILTSSTGLSVEAVLGANYVLAGVLASAAGL